MKKHNIYKLSALYHDISVGNLGENLKRLLEKLNKEKSYLTITPYLALPSIGSIHLSEKWYFIRDLRFALFHLLKNTKYKGIFTLTLPLNIDNVLFIGTIVIKNKKIQGIIPQTIYKSDYKKYFTNSNIPTKLKLKDKEIPIGKLIFNDKDLTYAFIMGDDNKDYLITSKYYLDNNVDLIIDISNDFLNLENYELAKNKARAFSYENNIGYFFTSPSNTETVSNYLYQKETYLYNVGKPVKEANYLNDGNVICDFDLDFLFNNKKKKTVNKTPKIDIIYNSKNTKYDASSINKNPFITSKNDIKNLFEMQMLSLRKKILSMPEHLRKVIIGISGGLDSALALLVASYTFDNLGLSKKDIITVIMPSCETSKKSLDNARKLTDYFKTQTLEFNIDEIVEAERKLINNKEKNTTYENIQARIRTNMLLNIANQYQGFVIGTGDLSEIALGYTTFGGDNISMFNINSSIPKTLVRLLVKHYKDNIYKDLNVLDDILEQKISAELNNNQNTEELIGKYEINDFILYHFLISSWSREKLSYFVKEVFNLTSDEARLYVKRFFKLFLKNQFKIKQIAEGTNISGIMLGLGRSFYLPGDHNAE